MDAALPGGNGRKLPQFDGSKPESYSDYRFKFVAHLDEQEPTGRLKQHVTRETNAEGELVLDVLPANPAALRQAEKRAYGQLVSSLAGEALSIAKNCECTCRETLVGLDARYKPQRFSARITAIKKLLSMPKGDNSVDSYFAEKQRIVREELDGRVSINELLIASLMGGLPEVYDQIAGNILSMEEEDEVDVATLLRQCREKQRLLDDRRDENATGQVATVNTASTTGTEDIMKKVTAMCNSVMGQVKNVANSVKKDSDKAKNQPKGPKCWNCGRFGHKQQDCKAKKGAGKKGKKGKGG